MLLRSFLFAGLLLLSGCAYDDGYYGGNTVGGYGETSSYYGGGNYYGAPYPQGSPAYASPYVSGPLFYYYDDDNYSRGHHHGNGNWDNDDWHHGNGNHGNGNQGNGHHGNGNQGGGWCQPGTPGCKPWKDSHNIPNNPDRPTQGWQTRTDRNPGNHNQKNGPTVYQVPRNSNGAGVPTMLPNGCGRKNQPGCN